MEINVFYSYRNEAGDGENIIEYIDTDKRSWFKSCEIGKLIGYKEPHKAARYHINEHDIKKVKELITSGHLDETIKCSNDVMLVNKHGFMTLLEKTKKEVLPSIRNELMKALGVYNDDGGCIWGNIRVDRSKPGLQSEYDLHTEIVQYLERFYKDVRLIPGLGELQQNDSMRKSARAKGYQKGQPDLLIMKARKGYSQLCIEFKTPKGTGRLSKEQIETLKDYSTNGIKCIVSNDLYEIINTIEDYMRD